jgi:hypothetical protein
MLAISLSLVMLAVSLWGVLGVSIVTWLVMAAWFVMTRRFLFGNVSEVRL